MIVTFPSFNRSSPDRSGSPLAPTGGVASSATDCVFDSVREALEDVKVRMVYVLFIDWMLRLLRSDGVEGARRCVEGEQVEDCLRWGFCKRLRVGVLSVKVEFEAAAVGVGGGVAADVDSGAAADEDDVGGVEEEVEEEGGSVVKLFLRRMRRVVARRVKSMLKGLRRLRGESGGCWAELELMVRVRIGSVECDLVVVVLTGCSEEFVGIIVSQASVKWKSLRGKGRRRD